jgi:hypothetical protein
MKIVNSVFFTKMEMEQLATTYREFVSTDDQGRIHIQMAGGEVIVKLGSVHNNQIESFLTPVVKC